MASSARSPRARAKTGTTGEDAGRPAALARAKQPPAKRRGGAQRARAVRSTVLDSKPPAAPDPKAVHPAFAPLGPLVMPDRLIAGRTFAQRSRLLAAGMGWLCAGAACVAIAAALLLWPPAVAREGLLRAVHGALSLLPAAGGLCLIHRGLRPALARNVLNARGARQTLLGLGRFVPWSQVYAIELGDEQIRIRAGRRELVIPAARNVVQRHEPTINRWWRKAITGSGRRVVPLLGRNSLRPAVWAWLAGGQAVGAWLAWSVAVAGSYTAAGASAATVLAVAAALAGLRAAALAVERGLLTVEGIQHRTLLRRRSVSWSAVDVVALDRTEFDFTILRGRVDILAGGRRIGLTVDGEAFEDIAALIVRKSPRAYVVEHHTAQAAPPLEAGDEARRESVTHACRRGAIAVRCGAIIALGLALVSVFGCLIAGRFGLDGLAACCAAAAGICAWAFGRDWRQASRLRQTATRLSELTEAAWEDPSVKPEDDVFLDLVA